MQKKLERYAKAADIKASCHSFGIPLRQTCWKPGLRSLRSRSCWACVDSVEWFRYAKLSNQRVKQAYQQAMRKVMAKTRV